MAGKSLPSSLKPEDYQTPINLFLKVLRDYFEGVCMIQLRSNVNKMNKPLQCNGILERN